MLAEIPRRICTSDHPTPRLKEQVSLRGPMGVFEVFEGAPINQGFQWHNFQNMSYMKEPDYDSRKAIKSVRQRVVDFTNELGMHGEDTVLAHIIPFDTTVVDIDDFDLLIDNGEKGYFTPEAGAFFTTIPQLPLYTIMVDCTQTIMYAPQPNGRPVVGIIHSGRNETDELFPFNAITHAIQTYQLDPKQIKLGISPSLEPKHHKIRAEDIDEAVNDLKIWAPYMIEALAEGLYYLDVRSFVADQFMAAGVPPENIEVNLAGLHEFHTDEVVVSHRKATELREPLTCLGIAVEIQ